MSEDEPRPESADTGESSSENEALPGAWQPITPRGVAAFSRANIGRLILVQFIVALLITGSVLWFLTVAWFPPVREAIRQLPQTGVIDDQRLESPRTSTEPLVESRALGFVMDLNEAGTPVLSSDIRVKFRRRDLLVCALFGCHVVKYPAGGTIQFNQPELESWWAAWQPTIYVAVGLGCVVWLFVTWFLLATIYCPIVRVYAFFKDRQITLVGSWKLAGAALMPGALLAGLSIVLYGSGMIGLVRFLILWLLHLIVGWVYILVGPLRLPKASDAIAPVQKNPFGDEKAPPRNPFTSE